MTNERSNMKIMVIGGSELIGSKLMTKLGEYGHQSVGASSSARKASLETELRLT
jgi:nucleoside-diphosphate-sugar epimerase